MFTIKNKRSFVKTTLITWFVMAFILGTIKGLKASASENTQQEEKEPRIGIVFKGEDVTLTTQLMLKVCKADTVCQLAVGQESEEVTRLVDVLYDKGQLDYAYYISVLELKTDKGRSIGYAVSIMSLKKLPRNKTRMDNKIITAATLDLLNQTMWEYFKPGLNVARK